MKIPESDHFSVTKPVTGALLTLVAVLGACSSTSTDGAGGAAPCDSAVSSSSSTAITGGPILPAVGAVTAAGGGAHDAGPDPYPECEPGQLRLVGRDINDQVDRIILGTDAIGDLLSSIQIDWIDGEYSKFLFFDWQGATDVGIKTPVTGALRINTYKQIQEITPGSTVIFYADQTNLFVELVQFHIFVYPSSSYYGCYRRAAAMP